MSEWEVFEDEAGEFRWRLRASNGEIVAVSKGYSRIQDAQRGVVDAKANASEAKGEGDATATNTPSEGPTAD